MLLGMQCAAIFGLLPASAAGFPLPASAVLALLTAFASLAVLMSRGRWTLVAGGATMVLAGLAVALQHWSASTAAVIAGDGAAVATFALLSAVVFGAVYGPGRFTGHRVRGAVVLYLNIGLVFALLHRLLAELVPGAYAKLPDPAQREAFRAAVEYFSFSTLTSVGYGDVVPVHPFARSLSTLEAAVGQLFPATLLARAVTLAANGAANGAAEGAVNGRDG